MAKQKKAEAANGNGEQAAYLAVSPPNFKVIEFLITGEAPLCINKFSEKAKVEMMEKQKAGQSAQNKKNRTAKDFGALWRAALYVHKDGWHGIHAASFRNAMISACRTVNFKMTIAKQSIFILPDGSDAHDNSPLVKITKGQPQEWIAPVRNATGVIDLRARPLWQEGWQARVRVQYDRDQFKPADIYNLLMRAGIQVGVGEGRPDSRESAGIGFGRFRVEEMIGDPS